MKCIAGLLALLLTPMCLLGADAPQTGHVSGKVVILRAKPSRNSEILARLAEGTPVEIREKVELHAPKPGDPTVWYRVGLAPHAKVWVHTLFVDPATKTVKPNRLNLRAGPGENYTIVGRIHKGTALESLSTKGDWIQIVAPADAYAFIAANFVKTEEPPAVDTLEKPETKPEIKAEEVTQVEEVTEPKVEEGTLPNVPQQPVKPVAAVVEPSTPVTAEVTTPPLPEATEPEPLPRRVVTREGMLRRNLNINSPTGFDLEDVRNGKHLNYLLSVDPSISLKKYLDKRVIVVGEEKMDKRWKRVPVLSIESLDVLD